MGGGWIDATVYVTAFPEGFFKRDFFTLRKEGLFSELIFRGRWSSFFIYAGSYGNYFQYLRDVFFAYWKEHNEVVDYLMTDYFIKIMYDTLPGFRELIKSVPETERFYDLNLMINEAYEAEVFNTLCEQCCFHKLTYKKEFVDKDEKGKETYYHYLISDSALRKNG